MGFEWPLLFGNLNEFLIKYFLSVVSISREYDRMEVMVISSYTKPNQFEDSPSFLGEIYSKRC
jgi:hypothetical protein